LNHKKRTVIISCVFIFLVLLCFLASLIIVNHITSKKLKDQISELSLQIERYKANENSLQEQLDKAADELESLQSEYDKLKKLKESRGESTDTSTPIVYLTFDDGPSLNTIKILDILKENDIKATFFVVGNDKEYAKDIYKRIVDEGHTLGNHTYDHSYKKIYTTSDGFWQSFDKLDHFLMDLIGVKTTVMRFPGGSNNTVSNKYNYNIMNTLVKQAKERGHIYFDWNVSSLDAVKAVQSKEVIVNEVLKQTKQNKKSIVLMHDSSEKTTTVEALPEIIKALKDRGCEFAALDETVEPIEYLKPE
jgi:esterase (fragment)